MGLDLNRWFNYAKARVNSAVSDANSSLDRREAEREAEAADRPWLRSESVAPSMDEARARIEWEAEQQRERSSDPRAGVSDEEPGVDSAGEPPPPARRSPQDIAEEAERETARLELDRRAQASADRLRAIRDELGVDDPAPPTDVS